jgi:hypothetical protein
MGARRPEGPRGPGVTPGPRAVRVLSPAQGQPILQVGNERLEGVEAVEAGVDAAQIHGRIFMVTVAPRSRSFSRTISARSGTVGPGPRAQVGVLHASEMRRVLVARRGACLESYAVAIVATQDETAAGDDLSRQQRRSEVQDHQIDRSLDRRPEALVQEVERRWSRHLIEEDGDVGIAVLATGSSTLGASARFRDTLTGGKAFVSKHDRAPCSDH